MSDVKSDSLPADHPKAATRELRRSGGSCVVTIPPAVMEQLGFEEGDDLDIRVDAYSKRALLEKADTTD